MTEFKMHPDNLRIPRPADYETRDWSAVRVPWVGKGPAPWPPSNGGVVQVATYTQTRNGHEVAVSGYGRAAPPHHDEHTKVAEAGIAGQTDAVIPPQPKPDPSTVHIVKDLDAFKTEALARTELYSNGHCVKLVQEAIPDIGNSSTWRVGVPLHGIDNPPLEPGTAIATFEKDGTYRNLETGQHAAIFLRYGHQDGKDGIWVLEQYQDAKRPREKFYSFDPNRRRTHNAYSYATVKKQ